MSQRNLNETELRLAFHVFQHTIPYRNIYVTDSIGLQNRPYTVNFMGGEERDDTYHLNVGTAGFAGMDHDAAQRAVLIHELTHVWQSCHSAWAPLYIFNSVWHQATSRDAYRYSAGGPWDDYNVEQQASIVEDWFMQGHQDSNPLFPYIRDTIRTAATR